jgi:hypothetical protein
MLRRLLTPPRNPLIPHQLSAHADPLTPFAPLTPTVKPRAERARLRLRLGDAHGQEGARNIEELGGPAYLRHSRESRRAG